MPYTVGVDTELIVLLDAGHKPIGTAPKLASHHAHTPLHLAFSCYIFNAAGELLVTQRALGKKVWPGVWTNSVCGHPAPGETLKDAVRRRAGFELGIDKLQDIKMILPDYSYTTPPFNGIIENEFCPVFFATATKDPEPNPDEIEAWHWQSIAALKAAIQQQPERYSYWLKDQLPQLAL